MKGKIQTVLGLIEPDSLGVTLTHEHLMHDSKIEAFTMPWPQNLPVLKPSQHIDLENLGWIRQYPYCFEENLEFIDQEVKDAVIQEMNFFKSVGGGAIVENTSIGSRAEEQPYFLKNLSMKTGVHIIGGTGFFHTHRDPNVRKLTCEEMEKITKADIVEGVDQSGIRCGVIGEIGCSWPIKPFDRNILRSAAAVQEELGCPVNIHPGLNSKHSPVETIRIFQEAGGKASQTVMSHLDCTITDKEELAEFASIGCYCEMDLFGWEVSHWQLNEDVDMPSDAERISRLHYLVDQGFSDKIVISHDIHTRHRLMKFGGHGYSHILLNVVPKMLKRGISQDIIDQFLIHNPKRWLTFQ